MSPIWKRRLGRLWPYVWIYLGLMAAVTIFQRKLIYHPTVLSPAAAEDWARQSGLTRWTNSAGQAIGWRRAAKPGPATASVLVTHGNAGWAAQRSGYADGLEAAGAFDVFVLEYPGYGDRTGAPGEAALMGAAEEAFAALPADRPVCLVGESLGTGVAAQLAGAHPGRVAGVLLVAPYDRLGSVAQRQMPIFPTRWMLRDRFDSARALRKYQGPLAVWLAREDRVVPAVLGRRLFEGYAGPKRLREFDGVGHNDLPDQPVLVWREVVGFWERARVPR